jgi:hypothetical protein
MIQAMRNAVGRKMNNAEGHAMPGVTPGVPARRYAIVAIMIRAPILDMARVYRGP